MNARDRDPVDYERSVRSVFGEFLCV